jgi:hypothetical protein
LSERGDAADAALITGNLPTGSAKRWRPCSARPAMRVSCLCRPGPFKLKLLYPTPAARVFLQGVRRPELANYFHARMELHGDQFSRLGDRQPDP